jgi:hypothetical protein
MLGARHEQQDWTPVTPEHCGPQEASYELFLHLLGALVSARDVVET